MREQRRGGSWAWAGMCVVVIALGGMTGCFVAHADWFTGYTVSGKLVDADGRALEGVTVGYTRLVDADGVIVFSDPSLFDRTDSSGEFERLIGTLTGRSCFSIFCLLRPPRNLDAFLPEPAFVLLGLPDTNQTLSVEVTQDMVTRDPESSIDSLDLGVIVVPAERADANGP